MNSDAGYPDSELLSDCTFVKRLQHLQQVCGKCEVKKLIETASSHAKHSRVDSTRVDQHRNEFSEFQEAAGPAMDEDQGDGIGALGPLMHKVQVDGVHMHREVIPRIVDDGLLGSPVEAIHPVLQQLLHADAE